MAMARVLTVLLLAACVSVACGDSSAPPVLQVQGKLLSVDNRTPHDWVRVEIWINRQYRVTVPRIAAGTRFTTTLDVFVAGFGQRFNVAKQRVDSLALTATQPDGTPVSHVLGDR